MQVLERPRMVSIGAVCEALGVSRSTLRLWEDTGVIPPANRLGGSDRRFYSESEIEALRMVAEARRRKRKGDPTLATT